MKLLTKHLLMASVAMVFIFTVAGMPAGVSAFPTQATSCPVCHSADGHGVLSITDAAGVAGNSFAVEAGGKVTIVAHGAGVTHEGYSTGPAVALELGPVLYEKTIVTGAKPSGEGSYTYYVQDGDENDEDPSTSNVKAVLVISPSSDTPAQDYSLKVQYLQKGPSSKTSTIVLQVAGKEVPTVAPTPVPTVKPELDCIECHETELKGHDKLGVGNAACKVCHDRFNMTKLQLANGTLLPLADAPFVCRQCHQDRFAAWTEGMHGKYGPNYAKVDGKVICSKCHDPHQPPFPSINPLPPQFEEYATTSELGLTTTTVDPHASQRVALPDGWLAVLVTITVAAIPTVLLTRKRK